MCVRKIFVHESTKNDRVTKQILIHYPDCEVEIINEEDVSKIHRLENSKQILLLTHSKGGVVKGCPGTTKDYLCCKYQIINQTINCPLNCTYCILQFYLNQPATVIYTDFDKIFSELEKKLSRQQKRFIRIGTGELGDSLALYGSRLFAKQAIEFFSTFPDALFEIKSKVTKIDDLLPITHNRHTVFSWSLNPAEIISAEEMNTASLEQRLQSAKKAEIAGFLLGFHFDPIIIHKNWKKLYSNLIDILFSTINPKNIAWISLGSLRFPSEMKAKIISRYPQTKIVYEEMIRGLDGKMRYARPLRVPIYKFIYQKLTTIDNHPFIYFCMENSTVWKEVMGFSPGNNAHLDWMFADSIYKRINGILKDKPNFFSLM